MHGGAPHGAQDPDDCRVRAPQSADSGGSWDTLDPFNLFCAYHLGITRDNGFKMQALPDVARRFGVDVQTLKQHLQEYGLETDALRRAGFDVEYAKLDIQVAPEGVSRRELARTMWEEIEDLRDDADDE